MSFSRLRRSKPTSEVAGHFLQKYTNSKSGKLDYLFHSVFCESHLHCNSCTLQADILAVLFDEILLEPADDEVTTATFQPLTTKQSILDYLGGYVVNNFLTQTCTAYVETLKTSSRLPSDLTATESKGYLQVPSARLLRLLQVVENHVERFTVEKVASGTVYMDIVDSILSDDRTVHASVGCQSHFVATTVEIVYFFLRCRLHFFTREKIRLKEQPSIQYAMHLEKKSQVNERPEPACISTRIMTGGFGLLP